MLGIPKRVCVWVTPKTILKLYTDNEPQVRSQTSTE